MEPFDVVLVPFPYVDKDAEKRRPALVVSSPQVSASNLFWLLMITSRDDDGWVGDYLISDLAAAGLPAPSRVRTSKIATVETSRMISRLGRLCEEDQAGVRASLAICAGW